MDYPIWQLAMGEGMLMGIVAIAHVIVSHFAIGGGLVIAVTETLSVRGNDRELRELARRGSLVLILISTVFGAISGVGIWVVAGLISPGAISALIHNYVWGWAMEWTFFVIEIAAALIYYATWNKISKGAHLALIWIYFVAAWMSLFIINGIITYMLTPGAWLETRAFWDGFFNPTFWPSLVLRTGIALIMATAFLVFPALRAAEGERPRLARYLGLWLVIGTAVSAAGYFWWEGALPEGVQALFLGEDPALAALASTRAFLLWALGATALLGVLFLLLLPRIARSGVALVPAVLLAIAAFSFFGGYERLREGARKPFLIHDYMFSNGVRVEDIATLNEQGVLSRAPWAGHSDLPADLEQADPVVVGRAVFRAQCADCHTLDGYLAIRPLIPEDPTLISAVLELMSFQADMFVPGEPVDKASLAYPFMPPFVGTADEMSALSEYLISIAPESSAPDGEQSSERTAPPRDRLARKGAER
jgi:mono/diheme cytochrome c family protein